MALLDCHFHSDTLGLATSMYVILPQPPAAPARHEPWPVLYLLHGLSDDHSIWLRRTSIERYVATRRLAVVMPTVHRGFYTDMHQGGRYWTFISEELPRLCRSFFPLTDRREESFVAGLSMGGYGALKLGLRCPDRFAAAASLSGAVDIAALAEEPGRTQEWERIFGPREGIPGGDDDLFALADRLAASDGPRPRLYQWCGTDDFLYQHNLRYRDHLNALGLPLTYEEGPGGHGWECWDTWIQRVLDWLELPEAGG